MKKLYFIVKPEEFFTFLQLTATGFSIRTRPGTPIRRVLSEDAHIASAYLDNVVQTIFHNGWAVDDERTATVEKGSHIALSAAMPGLVGAVFRKNSPVAKMRTSNCANTAPSPAGEAIDVTLKFFNRVNADLGPLFLKQGIRLPKETAIDFLQYHKDRLKSICREIRVDDRIVEPGDLSGANWPKEILLAAAPA